jgi:hypothetical protein
MEKIRCVLEEEIPKIYVGEAIRMNKDDCPFDECDLGLEFERGDISMTGSKEEIQLRMQYNGKIRIGYRKYLTIGNEFIGYKKIILLDEKQDIEVHAKVSTPLNISLNEKWQIKSRIDPKVHLDKAETYIGPVEISLRSYLTPKIQKELQTKAEGIEKSLQNSINLRESLNPYWQSLKDPILLEKDPPVWLDIYPGSFFLQNMTVQDSVLVFGLGAEALLNILTGEKPEIKELGPIPGLNIVESKENLFYIDLPVNIRYKDASEVLNESLAKEPVKIDDKTEIKIKNIKLYAKGNFLIVKFKFTASKSGILKDAKGKFYLYGKPVFDMESHILKVDSLDYDLRTKNLILNALDWFKHEKFRKKLQSMIIIDLKDQIKDAQNQVQDVISNVQIGNDLILNGNIENISLKGVYLLSKDISIHMIAKGNIAGRINGRL